MADLKKKYYGHWFICNTDDECYDCTGSLYFNEKGELTLEVHHGSDVAHKLYHIDTYDAIYGKDDCGVSISLFHAVRTNVRNFVETTFRIQYALIGAGVESLYDKQFDAALVHFPYLRNWAFKKLMDIDNSEPNITKCRLDFSKGVNKIMTADVGSFSMTLWGGISDHITKFDLDVRQDTFLKISSKEKASIDDFLNAITPFSQFLSLTLFHRQFPDSISLMIDGDDDEYELLFNVRPSKSVLYSSVISFDKMNERIPALLSKWYAGYDLVAPVSTHLVKSLSLTQPFDHTDFLIIAFALDGYFKRFLNKKDGKDSKKNKDGLEKLIKHFENVDVIRECNIDPEVFVQTRDKYTHLLKDEDMPKAITDYKELVWLAEKGKILLTCCLLDYMGMTTEEINQCCNESPIRSTLHFIKEHENKKLTIQ